MDRIEQLEIENEALQQILFGRKRGFQKGHTAIASESIKITYSPEGNIFNLNIHAGGSADVDLTPDEAIRLFMALGQSMYSAFSETVQVCTKAKR
jgi:hypothetical protein